MKRLCTIAAVALTVILGGAAPAMAHNALVNSDPPEGAQVSTGPKEVRLTFDQPVREGYNTITVTGPDGTYWTDGAVRADGNSLTAPVRELGPAGTYTVGYRVLSDDGHPVPGKVTFTLTAPGHGTPAPPPKDAADQDGHGQHSGGMPVWPWVAGAVLLVAAGLVLALRLGRR